MKTVRTRPLGNRVVVLPDEKEKETDAGIKLADGAEDPVTKGTVLRTGRLVEEIDASEGDEVLFPHTAGVEFSIDGQRIRIMTIDEIFSVIEKKDE